MKKFWSLLIVLTLLTASMLPAFADSAPVTPVVYESTFTVTSAGGTYNVGFVKVEFKKNFLGADMLPMTFKAKVFAVGELGCIEFSPDVAVFLKDVKIKVGAYKGALFDETTGASVLVDYKPQVISASHFSRYCWH